MKNAFSVFVFGKYERYLPYYVFSIETAYPNADVIIFYNNTLSSKIKKYLAKKPQVKLYEEFYNEYNYFENYRMYGGGGLTLLRYLIPQDYFKSYQNVYFGDVDIFILKESDNLFSFHEQQAANSKLPFSNRVRLLPSGGLSERLTGLHFVIVKPYFSRVNTIIRELLDSKMNQDHLIGKIKRDEELLYAINKTAFNFTPENLIHNTVPLHGLHFGLFRSGKQVYLEQIQNDCSLSSQEIKLQLESLLKVREFRSLLRNFFSLEMIKVFLLFEIQMPISLNVKYTLVTNEFFKPIRKFAMKMKKGW